MKGKRNIDITVQLYMKWLEGKSIDELERMGVDLGSDSDRQIAEKTLRIFLDAMKVKAALNMTLYREETK